MFKFIGLGVLTTVKDPFNQFDIIIVAISVLELGLATVSNSGAETGVFTVMRAGRLFRIFKLVKSWPSLRRVLGTLQRTFPKLGPSRIFCVLKKKIL